MPAPWAAWTRILSCKQQTSIKTVQDPKTKKKKKKKKKTKAAAAMRSSMVRNPALDGSKASSSSSSSSSSASSWPFVGQQQQTRRRKKMGVAMASSSSSSSSSSSCCNDLKSVVHGNTRVVHRGDDPDSPPQKASPHHLLLVDPASIAIEPQASRQQKPLKHCSFYNCSPSADPPPPSHILHGAPSSSSSSRRRISSHGIPAAGDGRPDHRHHHCVTELRDGDSARSIVEIIFHTSWMRQDMPSVKPDGIYKVHNSPKALAKFEEYRDCVKSKASKTSKKNSRCLVDGNELLRFYSTTVSCNMGGKSPMSPESGSSSFSDLSLLSSSSSTVSLCMSSSCGVCCILRHGFPIKGYPGIYTNASSGRAHGSGCHGGGGGGAECGGGGENGRVRRRRAMIVCRVIAGRVKRMGLESSQDGSIPSVYDSVAGEASQFTDLEELLVFNARAVLPCFIVIYSC